jgi:hypothetical protein
MKKLTVSERKILNQLIHLETFDSLITETGLKYGELRDDLTNLISRRLIQVFDEHNPAGNLSHTAFYDLDNLNKYSFRISGQGLNILKV